MILKTQEDLIQFYNFYKNNNNFVLHFKMKEWYKDFEIIDFCYDNIIENNNNIINTGIEEIIYKNLNIIKTSKDYIFFYNGKLNIETVKLLHEYFKNIKNNYNNMKFIKYNLYLEKKQDKNIIKLLDNSPYISYNIQNPIIKLIK